MIWVWCRVGLGRGVFATHVRWLTYRQTLGEVIAGLEATWVSWGELGVASLDNMKTIGDRADATASAAEPGTYSWPFLVLAV